MRKLSAFLPNPVLKKVYFSLVHPYIIYGVEVWGHTRSSKISKLVSIQNRCFRFFNSTNDQNVMTFDVVVKYFSLLKFFQNFKMQRSMFIFSQINCSQVDHHHFTRFSSRNNLLCPHSYLSTRQFSFVYKTIQIWNDIPVEIRHQPTYLQFKNKLRQFLLV